MATGGIGKSRLVEMLREGVASEGAPGIMLRCSPYYTQSALYPVIEHLQRVLDWRRDNTPAAKLDILERALSLAHIAFPVRTTWPHRLGSLPTTMKAPVNGVGQDS